MSEKHRWFQIHLSTAIVMMFVAGIILWANFRPLEIRWANDSDIFWYWRGWPFYSEGAGDNVATIPDRTEFYFQQELSQQTRLLGFQSWKVILLNILTMVMILVILGSSVEFFIRRREARHEGSK